MSGLIRELLLDYSLNKLSIDLKSDLTVAIQTVLTSRVFTKQSAIYLDMYLSGYTADEIAIKHIKHTAEIEQELERLFDALEEYSGYTDEAFIHKLCMTYKYRSSGIRDLTTFLSEHSKHYTTHDMKVV